MLNFIFFVTSLLAIFSLATANDLHNRQGGDVTSFVGSIASGATSVFGAGTSGAASAFSQATSGAASVISDASSLGSGIFETVTSVGGSVATIVTSQGGDAITLAGSAGGRVTSFGGHEWTVAASAATGTSNAALGAVHLDVLPVVLSFLTLAGGAMIGALITI